MKYQLYTVTVIAILLLFAMQSGAQTRQVIAQTASDGTVHRIIILDNDTFPFVVLKPVYVFAKRHFKNKKEEQFYWRTVRDVKRVLPLAHYIRQVVVQTNDTLMTMPGKRERDRYMKGFEKSIFKQNEAEFSKLTLNQGKLLIRLVDREFNVSSYELIKAYRGRFTAGFWQLFAKLLGADLKDSFGSKEQDAIIEQIIRMVEDGDI
ncbi:MAG: DUF4294 domain-containing protein [Prevotellaceae bacterium]|nr:DUF4294 domain-containing protein [Prevotellaceae bacterium]